MITIHVISKTSSESFSRSIDPKSDDEFQYEICELVTEGRELFGKFYLDFDSMDGTEEQKEWVDAEMS